MKANIPSTVEEQEQGTVIEMCLCEVEHVFLHPNQKYRFVVLPGCKRGQQLAVLAQGANSGK